MYVKIAQALKIEIDESMWGKRNVDASNRFAESFSLFLFYFGHVINLYNLVTLMHFERFSRDDTCTAKGIFQKTDFKLEMKNPSRKRKKYC